jgi:hypothetical protein
MMGCNGMLSADESELFSDGDGTVDSGGEDPV